MKKILLLFNVFLGINTVYSQSDFAIKCATHSEHQEQVIQAQLSTNVPPFQFQVHKITDYKKQVNVNLTVILVDFTDLPQNYRDMWPTEDEWERILFHGKSQELYKNYTNDNFTITGDIFGYHTSNSVFWDNNTYTTMSVDNVLAGMNFNIPGFDLTGYDYVLFVVGHDAVIPSSFALHNFDFTVNGQAYNKDGMALHFQIGNLQRDAVNSSFRNTLELENSYILPLDGGGIEDYTSVFNMSQTEATFCHEFGHQLGIAGHANSRTNGASFDYQPEIPNNSDYYAKEYGNNYDIMGGHTLSPSLNGHFRDFIGLLPQDEIETVNDIGTKTVTVWPINSTNSKRYLEVLIPFTTPAPLLFKDAGCALEVKQVDEFNEIFNNPLVSENLNGLFVHKMSGISSQLLDMSPSPNFFLNFGGSNFPYYDIRDVVLKPGMTYENDDVKFSNVIANANGSFTLDVEIKHVKQATPAPTLTSIVPEGNNQARLTWQNNHLASGNNSTIQVQYQPSVMSISWADLAEVPNNATTFLTPFGFAPGTSSNFRLYVKENTTHLPSKTSNAVGFNCSLIITDLEEYPVECFGTNTGKIEIFARGGTPPYLYKLDGGTFSGSNTISNLSTGTHTVVVRDANG